MKLTDEQIAEVNSKGLGCSVIKSCISPDAANDKTLPTNAYLMELAKDGETWFDLVMGNSVDIFDTYYDMLGDVIKKMSYTKGTRSPGMYTNPSAAKKPKKSKK